MVRLAQPIPVCLLLLLMVVNLVKCNTGPPATNKRISASEFSSGVIEGITLPSFVSMSTSSLQDMMTGENVLIYPLIYTPSPRNSNDGDVEGEGERIQGAKSGKASNRDDRFDQQCSPEQYLTLDGEPGYYLLCVSESGSRVMLYNERRKGSNVYLFDFAKELRGNDDAKAKERNRRRFNFEKVELPTFAALEFAIRQALDLPKYGPATAHPVTGYDEEKDEKNKRENKSRKRRREKRKKEKEY